MSESTATPAELDAASDLPAKPTFKHRYKALITEYGSVAIVTYLAIFVTSLLTFAALIKFGVTDAPESAGAEAGIWFSAWVATKVLQPVRIIATLGLTPVAAKIWHRFRPPTVDPDAEKAAPEGTAD